MAASSDAPFLVEPTEYIVICIFGRFFFPVLSKEFPK